MQTADDVDGEFVLANVQLQIDANGILTATVWSEGSTATEGQLTMTIENDKGRLTKEQIEAHLMMAERRKGEWEGAPALASLHRRRPAV